MIIQGPDSDPRVEALRRELLAPVPHPQYPACPTCGAQIPPDVVHRCGGACIVPAVE